MVPMFDAVMFDYVHEADRRIGKAMMHQDALIRLLDALERKIKEVPAPSSGNSSTVAGSTHRKNCGAPEKDQ